MAEVGVLQLTIEDNSESAAKGLGHLADALERVRNAVGSGLGLEGTSNEIEKIGKAVNDYLSGSTFEKLKQFSESLQGLKDVDLSGISKAIKSVGEESGNPGKQISESLVAGIEEGMSKVDLLREKVGILRGEMDEGIDKETFDDKRIVNYALQIANLEEQIGRLEEVERRAGDAEQWTKFSEEFSTIDAYAMKLSALREKLSEGINSGKWDNEKIANAVLKIQSLEERIEKLKELQSDGVLKTTNEEAIQAANNFLSASTNIDLLKQKLDAMKAEMGQGILSGAWDEKKLSSYAIQVQNLEEKIRKLSAAAKEAKPNLDGVTEVTGDPGSAFNEVEASVEGAAGSTGALSDGMTDVAASVEEAAGSGRQLAGELKKVKKEAESASGGLKKTHGILSMLKSGFEKMFPTLSTFLSGMGRIAKYRLIRTIIKQITSGMSEGIQNVYHYSQAIGGSFAPSMDSAASALLQMKNSIGAALAPLIQNLIPYLQIVVNWFITAINYVNQFFALLRGQATWTRAMPATVTAFNNQTKAANKAHKAMKDLLADWDELNIIQNKSGGSGGGGGAAEVQNYASMFEEVSEYEDRIKNLVDGIRKQFGDIWGVVKRIGLAILGWKLSSVFTGWLGTIAGIIGAGAIADLVFNITTLLNNQYLKTGEDGWLIANVLETLLGAFLMKKVLGNILDGSFAKLAIPLTLSISALADFTAMIGATDVSAISTEALKISALGALKSGAAAGYIAHLFGASLGTSIVGGVAATLLTFGVAIGIKAVERSVKGQITEETIKATALSSLAMGVGTGMFAKLLGATALAATGYGALAAGLAVLTIGAAIAIKAIISSQKKDIEWGNLTLTQEQVKSFVLNEMFEAGFQAKLELIKGKVQASQETKDDIQKQIESIEIPVSKLKWKIDEKNAIDDLKKKVFGDSENGTTGLIGKFQELAKEQKNLVETSFTIAPIKSSDGTDESGKFVAASIEGWDILTQAMDDLGLELNKHLTQSMNNNLSEEMRQYEKNAAVEVVETMARISRAATLGLTSGQSEVKFSIGLENMSRESIGDAIALYQEYINDIKQEYINITTEAAASYRSQAALFAELANSTQDAELKRFYQQKAQEYEDLFNEYKEKVLHGVEEATKGDQAKGRALFVEWIQKMLQFTSEDFGKVTHTANPLSDYVKTVIGGLGIAIRKNEGSYAEEMKDQLGNVLSGMLQALLTEEDFKTIKSAIDAGLLNYADIFQDDVIQQIIDHLSTDGYYGEAIRKAWQELIQDSLGDNSEIPASATEPIQNDMNMDTTVYETVEYATAEGSETESPAVTQVKEDIAGIEGAVTDANNGATFVLNDLKFDTTGAQSSASKAAWAIEDMASRIIDAFKSLDGIGFEFSAGSADKVLEKMHAAIQVTVPAASEGGVFRSGDIFSANENGQTELIASYGNRTAVMNNDQVVGAVTNGVAQANSGVEARLTAIESRLIAMMNKEWVARAVPSSGWGQHAQQSADAYSRVTG